MQLLQRSNRLGTIPSQCARSLRGFPAACIAGSQPFPLQRPATMASMTKSMLGQRAVARPSVATRRASVVVRAQDQGTKVALLGLTVAALQAAPARADQVDTAVESVTDIVKATGNAVKTGLEVVGAGVNLLKQGYEVAAPVIKQGVDAVTPAVAEAVKVTSEAAAPVVQKATPVVQETVQSVIKGAGVDVDSISRTTTTVVKTATEGANAATPFLTKAVNFLTTTEPVLLAEYGLAAVALYYLAPPLAGALFGGLRGFAGEISAAQALDTLGSESNAVLIDIRTEGEKEASGLPDAPSSASGKLLEVEYAAIGDRKLRGQLRDAGGIEAQVTALQIASLKRLGRGTRIMLLDRYGSTAKTVAKELARRGFGRVFVVSGGFDGRGGWVQSKLLVKPTAGMYSGDVSSKLARTLSTRNVTAAGRKALPAPSK